MTKFILSYGGGINSTALLFHIVKNKMPLDYVVFADTGNEIPETYETVRLIKDWCQQRNIKFKTVYPAKMRSLWTRCFKRKVIPSQLWRWCTRDVKVKPIHKFYKKLGDNISQYMGIHFGEVHRMKPSMQDSIENLYPLIDSKINQDQCIQIIQNEGFPLPVKSGCFFCPFNNKERWDWIKTNHPELFKLSQELEANNKHYPKQKLIVLQNQDATPCGSECMI